MAKKEQTSFLVTPKSGFKVRYRGAFDLPDFYRWMFYWLEDQGYCKDETRLEKKYIERRKSTIKNYEIEWEAGKTVNAYFSHKMQIRMLIVAVKPGEMQHKGETVEAEKGDAQLWINASVETPKWEELGFIQTFYNRYIQYRRLRFEKVGLYRKVYHFQNDIKKYLGINQ